MVTEAAFTAVALLVAVQRVLELARSRRHTRVLLAQGGHESAHWQVPALASLHTAWLVGSVVEVWSVHPPFRPAWAVVATVIFLAGQWLRLLAMRALGTRWTIPVITLPGTRAVTAGIYRHIRHPNYLGVILEIVSLPLMHGAVWSAGIFTILNGALLASRIRAEERALTQDSGYLDVLGSAANRFIPSASPSRTPHDT
jgi:methyltransferase